MSKLLVRAAVVAALGVASPAITHASVDEERRGLEELRNTVGNLLQALVERGVITREQAEGMVRDAQAKAEKDATAAATARAEQEKADAGAVRVPYVPEVVKDEIKKEVVADITPEVTRQVIDEAKSSDSLAAALPDWVRRMRWSGDFRVRGQGDS